MKEANEKKLGQVLKELMNAPHLKSKFFQSKIKHSWKKLMGVSIATYTKSIALRKHTLYLQIESAPLRQELSYAKDKIKEILNEELGETYIKEVVIR